ncbi:phage tail protein [Sulfurirhabdus autotrophica]|uniref:Microcystin-dependent protein n=1 Tax=Sulfurirhabdus autotrophica TaxID=1706046 RepID=A0A4V2W2R3_9PROT|nr:tail fiber protein [Sulfurirhabdus autotrophica]TCV89019.1 microcystin-dependent protein [Sulfurirhabdus autotrophica]
MDPFVGEIRAVGFNFAPVGWALCNGQLLPISQNTALFSLLGTTYGGNGQTTFALPNLQGRAMMHPGQGPGLTPHFLGETGGTASETLSPSAMPMHNHAFSAATGTATTGTPSGASSLAAGSVNTYGTANNLVPMGEVVGGNQPHNNMQPYLVLNYVIALQGVFPPRS